MLNNVTEIKKEKVNTGKIKFTDNSKLVRSSFIIGITVLLLLTIFIVIVIFVQPDPWIMYTISSIFLAISLSGLILNCIAFKYGKNVFNILGFIFNLIIIIVSVTFLITLSLTTFD
ncbi:MAG TPA: hypothetical protein VMZ29_06295 [Candidatus Bathyarchaeia archaeon]|nr:hypothetical protein [Candidatus Bathyarchaeia archaeon]